MCGEKTAVEETHEVRLELLLEIKSLNEWSLSLSPEKCSPPLPVQLRGAVGRKGRSPGLGPET